jgi:hypothetical protein
VLLDNGGPETETKYDSVSILSARQGKAKASLSDLLELGRSCQAL